MNNLIANLLSSIKNGNMNHTSVAKAHFSRGSLHLCNILYNRGYITSYNRYGKYIIVGLKYQSGVPLITYFKTHSTPGRKLYVKRGFVAKAKTINTTTIISSSKGFLDVTAAHLKRQGGKLVFTIR